MSTLFRRGVEQVLVTSEVNPGVVKLGNYYLRIKRGTGKGHVVSGLLATSPEEAKFDGAREIGPNVKEISPRVVRLPSGEASGGWEVFYIPESK